MVSISPDQQSALDRLPTKAARIRALRAEGLRQADIARHLGVSDQHVSNVLRRSERAGIAAERLSEAADLAEAPSSYTTAAPSEALLVQPDGSVRLPRALLESVGLTPGQRVSVTAEDGALRVSGYADAIRRIQQRMAKYKKPGVSVVDQFLAERRAMWGEED